MAGLTETAKGTLNGAYYIHYANTSTVRDVNRRSPLLFFS